jgi:hypothetical protein
MERELQETTAWIFGSGYEYLVGYPLNAIINYWKNKNKNTPYSSDRGSTPFVSLIHSSDAALHHVQVMFLTSTKRKFIISCSFFYELGEYRTRCCLIALKDSF